ncbi:MAG TPA: flagellar basal body-associated FliL family protein [Solirubrobacteraceae bacterium]|nr:flagellar basal body-associated FliL family protein [Solirubrobacteraceae bacterium]
MKKKLMIILPILILGGGYEAKAKLMPPKVVKPKIAGEIYILPHQFMCNLQDGHYATFTLALELAPGQSDGATAATAGDTSSTSVVGTLPEEAVIRAIVTNLITDQTENTVISSSGRTNLTREILSDIKNQTDVKVDQVYFTDVAVQ